MRRRSGRRTVMVTDESDSVVAELEGTLLKDPDTFPYFMLVAFEASGLIRFVVLLLLWPLALLLRAACRGDLALRIMVFVAVTGIREAEIAAVARAVLPKFYLDDVDAEVWRVFSSCRRRVVVTALPRVMVAWFAKEHLGADEVVGAELVVSRHGLATGLLRRQEDSVAVRVQALFEATGHGPRIRLGRPTTPAPSFLSAQHHPPFHVCSNLEGKQVTRPPPVIFHDGRLVRRPTPATALLVILWIPFGVLLAIVRVAVGLVLPLWSIPYLIPVFGGKLIVRGQPPAPATSTRSGVLFVCNHRTLIDPLALTVVLGRKVTAVTYSISRISELLSPIRTVRLSRVRQVDAEISLAELAKGDLVVCPEGTTCREPFLLRFSMLFAELTDRIVPVAVNYDVGFFHATTARGWKAMDPVFFFMNPMVAYEVNFLNQLPAEATCSAGKSPRDVANYVQRVLAGALRFECTNYTRRDKYRILAGNDGDSSVPAAAPLVDRGDEKAAAVYTSLRGLLGLCYVGMARKLTRVNLLRLIHGHSFCGYI